MRSTLIVLCLGFLAGCCGADAATSQSYADPIPGASASEIAKSAAMDADVAPTGCTIQFGVACDGQEGVGARFDVPKPQTVVDFFTRLFRLTTVGQLPFREPASAESVPCQTGHYETVTETHRVWVPDE